MEICFGIAHWQIPSIFYSVICPGHDNGGILLFQVLLLLLFFIETTVVHANSVDADRLRDSVVSDLGLHCLPIPLLGSPD